MLTLLILTVLAIGIILSCIFIIYEHQSPAATMAWLLAMVLLPFIGLGAYFVFGRRKVNMRIRLLQAISQSFGDVRQKLKFDKTFSRSLTAIIKRHQGLMRLAYSFPGPPPTTGNLVEVQSDAKESYPDMFKAMAKAEKYIHAMYYIFRPDETGIKFRDMLIERAKAGVEVRLLYDDIGSWSMKLKFFEPLIEAGGQVREYRPVHFSRLRGAYANFRNHRKILVVDGKTAYTGGINIGDEYLGRDPELGYWRDSNIKLTGPAASHLQLIFAEDWFYVTSEMLGAEYLVKDCEALFHGHYIRAEKPVYHDAVLRPGRVRADRACRGGAQGRGRAATCPHEVRPEDHQVRQHVVFQGVARRRLQDIPVSKGLYTFKDRERGRRAWHSGDGEHGHPELQAELRNLRGLLL
jgi:cardiolipin synthase